nr:glycoside hydrolase family 76 protein [Dysgonomonas gadei]
MLSCKQNNVVDTGWDLNMYRAETTLDSLYKYYGCPDSYLLLETYPFDSVHKTTYQASEEQVGQSNQYSYLWPYSGTFSAVNALLEVTKDGKYKQLLDSKILKGLDEYFDIRHKPYAYASYINSAAQSDRFYDDNIWIGIDFTDTYLMTNNSEYLDKAKLIWEFILSGMDDKLGGGIYWVEQNKESKHACSNAPGTVLALKLFKATQDSSYFYEAEKLYIWTKEHLQDTTDYLIFDNINLNGKIDKTKYSYNSGQVMQAAVLLYQLTGNKSYLIDAQNIALSSYSFFFEDFKTANGEQFKILKKGDIWFTTVMLRGYIELYHADNNKTYIEAFEKNLNYAWEHMRDNNGLFNTDWTGIQKNDKKWLLTQAGMIEMYARISNLTNK